MTVVIAINCGSTAPHTASDGTEYVADIHYSGGSPYSTPDSISGTNDDPIYQSQRYGNFSYAIPLDDGTYDVTMHFAEIYQTAPGMRIFDVSLEGVEAISNLDVFETVGHDAAHNVTKQGVVVSGGGLNIGFMAQVENPMISGIRVETSTSEPPPGGGGGGGFPGRFVAEDFGAVGDGIADDWQALTNALAAAGSTPVILKPGAVYGISQPLVVTQGGFDGLQPGNSPRITARDDANKGTYEIIRLNPPGQNRTFVLRHLIIQNGSVGVYGKPSALAAISRHSIFQDIYIAGSAGDGFFFDDLVVTGLQFINIHAETCAGHGIRFRGEAILNASQLLNCRAVLCGGHGFLFENTAPVDTPAVLLDGCTAEWNNGSGFRFHGYHGHMNACYVEGNDNDQTGNGHDLTLGQSLDGTIPSRITATSLFFGPNRHPQNHRVGHGGGGLTQHLVLISPKFSSADVIDANNIRLALHGVYPGYDVQVKGYWGFLHNMFAAGWNLTGAIQTNAGGVHIGLPADPGPQAGAVLKVIASRATASGGGVAEYLVRRNEGGTVTPTLVAGTNFLTFGVDGNGKITVACPTGDASFCVLGF